MEREPTNSHSEKKVASFLEWFCPAHKVNPIHDHLMYKDRRTENTAVWIYEHPLYKEWRTNSSSFLWITGKSMQSHLIIIDAIADNSWCGKVRFDVLLEDMGDSDRVLDPPLSIISPRITRRPDWHGSIVMEPEICQGRPKPGTYLAVS